MLVLDMCHKYCTYSIVLCILCVCVCVFLTVMFFVVLVHVHVGSNMGRVGRRGGKGRGGKGERREVVVGGHREACGRGIALQTVAMGTVSGSWEECSLHSAVSFR